MTKSSEKLKLVQPQLAFCDSYVALINEFKAANEKLVPFVLTFPHNDFSKLLAMFDGHTRGEGIKPGFVPNSTYWLVRDGRTVVGVSNLRHSLNEMLKQAGGHIGYGIRPSERRKGYATVILSETLKLAQAKGLTQVLMTCAKGNIGSVKTITNNGGVFESEEFNPERGEIVQRFWIEL